MCRNDWLAVTGSFDKSENGEPTTEKCRLEPLYDFCYRCRRKSKRNVVVVQISGWRCRLAGGRCRFCGSRTCFIAPGSSADELHVGGVDFQCVPRFSVAVSPLFHSQP